MTQRPDDAARNLRNVWLGTDLGRWPFDARYTAWGLATVLSALGFFVYWLALPLGLLLATGSWLLGRHLLRRKPRWQRWAYTAGLLLVLVALLPHVRSWLLPMPWWAAWLPAILTAVLVTRRVMPHVDANRPVKYWRTVPGLIARAPRPRRPTATLDAAGVESLDPIDIHEALRLGLDHEEDSMAHLAETWEPITQPIECRQWLPLDPEAVGAFVAWLQVRGIEFQCVNGTGGKTEVAVGGGGGVLVRPGWWLYFRLTGRGSAIDMGTIPDAVFRERFRPVVLAAR